MTTISSITPNYHFSRIAEYVLGFYATGGPGAGTTASTSLISSLVYAYPTY